MMFLANIWTKNKAARPGSTLDTGTVQRQLLLGVLRSHGFDDDRCTAIVCATRVPHHAPLAHGTCDCAADYESLGIRSFPEVFWRSDVSVVGQILANCPALAARATDSRQ